MHLSGGHVDRAKVNGCRISCDDVVDALVPVNFYSPRPYLFGSGIPTRNEHLQTITSLGVTLLVSLTIDPLRPGRAINHQPHSGQKPEFTDIDTDIFQGVNLKVLHIPVTDGYPPTTEAMTTFLSEAKNAVDAGGKVYVHCWLGKGRTGTFLAAYLINWEGMDPKEAIDYIRELSPDSISAQRQVDYLLNPSFPTNQLEDSQPPPIVHTSPACECYHTHSQTTNLSLQRLLTRTTWMVDKGRDIGGGVCFIGSCD